MTDFDDLRIFERVATLRSFSAAARALGLPKASVSRAVGRLEARLGIRLLQRTTRAVAPTEAGEVLRGRSQDILGLVDDAFAEVGGLLDVPRGPLRISTGIGFGLNVLADVLPAFSQRYPEVTIALDLSSATTDLVSDRIDVAIRIGPLPDSGLRARRLGTLHRYLCAAPSYLARWGTPGTFEDLRCHRMIHMSAHGRRPAWTFSKGDDIVEHQQDAHMSVNCAVTLHRLIVNGAGIGISSSYLCGPEFQAGRLVRLFPDWALPAMPVHAVFPSERQVSPAVRAFIDFMVSVSIEGRSWQADPVLDGAQAGLSPTAQSWSSAAP